MANKPRSASTAGEKEEECAGSVVCESGAAESGDAAKDGKIKQKPGKKKVRDESVTNQKDSKGKGTDDEKKEMDLCSCGKPVKDDANGGIECDICGHWFHPKCECLNKDVIAAIETYKLFWLCSSCKTYSNEFRRVVKGEEVPCKGSDHSENLSRGNDCVKRKLTEISDALDRVAESFINQKDIMLEMGKMIKKQGEEKRSLRDLEATVKKVVKEETATYADAVKKLTSRMEKINNTEQPAQAKELRSAVTDCLEQDKRRKNVVVFNVPEQDEGLSATDQAAGDFEILIDLVMEGLKLKIHPEKVARVGRRVEGKTRLMVVTLRDEDEKWDLLKMAKNLRSAGSKFEKIYIAPDLSPAQQLRDRKLRKELKERRDAGEDVIIFKNKVIKRADRPKPKSSSISAY